MTPGAVCPAGLLADRVAGTSAADNGVQGGVTLSAAAWHEIAADALPDSLGFVEVKGKGQLEIFRFVDFRADGAAGVDVANPLR